MTITVKNLFEIPNFVFSLPEDKGVYTLTGENGSHKSTLMHILSGLLASKNLQESLKVKPSQTSTTTIKYERNGSSTTFTRQDTGNHKY